MRIRILRQTSISGRPARVGDVIDVADSDARILLGMKKAELVQDPEPTQVEITSAEPVLSPRKPRARIKG